MSDTQGAGIFSSMRTKMIGLILLAVVITGAALTALGILRIDRVSRSTSTEVMSLTCSEFASQLNERYVQIEHSVKAVEEYVEARVPTTDEVAEDPAVLDAHFAQVQEYFDSIASICPGVVTYYYRYRPDLYPTAGLFYVDEDRDGTFEPYETTDLSLYDADDVEHVGWYYIPVSTGEPLWMEPYWNANTNTYTLSYVVPLFDGDGNAYGVVGMDVDFAAIEEEIAEIQAYDTGKACLLSTDGTIVWHEELEAGTNIVDVSPELQGLVDQLGEDSSGDTLFEYTIDGEERVLTFCSLRNGMRLALAVPKAEIDAQRTKAITEFAGASVVSFALCAMLAAAFTSIMMRPLTDLTETARELERGNLEANFPKVTNDELGVLNDAMRNMTNNLRGLVAGLSSKAYHDALTGVRNKGAYEEEIAEFDDGATRFGLVMFDVNYLKAVNDQFGHKKGDTYLKNACAAICNAFRHSPVFRLGGDEFVAVLKGEQIDLAQSLMAALDEAAEKANAAATERWQRVDIAKGMAIYDPEVNGYEEHPVDRIYKLADEAMYRDKGDRRRA